MAIQELRNSSVLVTGGAGFIGSNLCETLLAQNNQVICLDNLATGKASNIKDLLQYPNFTFIEGDIRNLEDCRKAVANVQYVSHQAALGSVPRSIHRPTDTNEVNVGGFVNMLVAAKDAQVKCFVYASSSSVYGDHPTLPKEEANIGKALSPYAVSKLTNELYAEVFAKTYGLNTVGLRYFNVFGKRQDPDGEYAAVIPRFIKQLIAHQSPIIHGTGEQSRDFTYIENVLQINQLAFLATNPEALNTVYNVACGEQISLNTMYESLVRLLGKNDADIQGISPSYTQARKGDIMYSLASIEKAQKLLGYNPTHSFYQGLEASIEWYWQFLKKS
jgi:UDP-N-acetylglucosamine 4-epimerase